MKLVSTLEFTGDRKWPRKEICSRQVQSVNFCRSFAVGETCFLLQFLTHSIYISAYDDFNRDTFRMYLEGTIYVLVSLK